MGAVPFLVSFVAVYGGMIRCAIKSADKKPNPHLARRERHRRYL